MSPKTIYFQGFGIGLPVEKPVENVDNSCEQLCGEPIIIHLCKPVFCYFVLL